MRISDWSSDVCSSDLCFEFLLQLLLAGAQLFSECAHVGLRGARLSKHAAGRLFFLAHMMFDLFAEHRHFRSEEHTSELQSLMRISYAVFCLKKKKTQQQNQKYYNYNDIIHEPHTT